MLLVATPPKAQSFYTVVATILAITGTTGGGILLTYATIRRVRSDREATAKQLAFLEQELLKKTRQGNAEGSTEAVDLAEESSKEHSTQPASYDYIVTGARSAPDTTVFMSALLSAVSAAKSDTQPTLATAKTFLIVRDLITSYHRQALAQSRVQFWFSVVAATSGFSLILYLVLHAAGAGSHPSDVALKALPGLTMDAVAALFFRQASETRQRATDLYDRLRSDNERSQALQLIESIEESPIRAMMKAQLAMSFGGISSSPDLNTGLFGLLAHQQEHPMAKRPPTSQEGATTPRDLNIVQ
jgi:hypothetical protein